MSLGFTVQPCAYCNTLTAIRYKNMYACLDHVADAQRDDPQAHGRRSAYQLHQQLVGTQASDAPVTRQPSLPAVKAHTTAPNNFERLGAQMVKPSTIAAILPGVEIAVDDRVLTPTEARDEFFDLDPLHLEGFNPATKSYDTPSGTYEGPRTLPVVDVDPDDW